MNKYPIKIEWEIGDGYGQPWNELCAVIIESLVYLEASIPQKLLTTI